MSSRSRRILVLAILGLLVLAPVCIWWLWVPEDRTHSRQFKADLIAALDTAHRIELVEHSHPFDYGMVEDLEEAPFIEYKRLELTSGQRAELQHSLKKMNDAPQAMSLCLFENHHTMVLYDAKNEMRDVIQICFKCGDTEWGGTRVQAPEDFHNVFKQFIEPLGFQAERDWVELAAKSFDAAD